jgi:hypothetical protein
VIYSSARDQQSPGREHESYQRFTQLAIPNEPGQTDYPTAHVERSSQLSPSYRTCLGRPETRRQSVALFSGGSSVVPGRVFTWTALDGSERFPQAS